MSSSLLLVTVVVAALGFAWTNGFHDAANAVATSITTGALTSRVALGLAAGLNVLGALVGVGLAQTVTSWLTSVPEGPVDERALLAALLAALGWNLFTWWFGMPSSSSHALIGGLAGASLAAGGSLNSDSLVLAVVAPTLLSPLLGFLGAWLLTAVLASLFRDATHGPALRRFRLAQTLSTAAMAVGHGLQDGQKTAGVIVAGLVAGGAQTAAAGVPLWVRAASALALGAGTAAGGWRIIRTVGRRIARVDPVTGFAAEAVTSLVLLAGTVGPGAPISSTHTVVASIMGAGATRGVRTIRWPVVRRILGFWLLTPLVTAAAAAGLTALTR